VTDVVVVGSANVDLVLQVERIPRPGETVLARGLSRGPGGKGANQAVAAARCGASTAIVASIGDDDGGRLLRDALGAAGVDLSLLRHTATPTGTAIITVDAAGENAITVAPSSNAELVIDDVSRAAVASTGVVLTQLEIPFEAVHAAAAAAQFLIVNAAPAATLDAALLARIHLLVVNEHEAGVVSGVDGTPTETGQVLLDRVPAVVVTLGREGALVLQRGTEPEHVPGLPVDVVDTTAAGDTFCGALAASLAQGATLSHAVRKANAAASLCVQKAGAIASIPDVVAVDAQYRDFYG